jgi:hypothetical protein
VKERESKSESKRERAKERESKRERAKKQQRNYLNNEQMQ